MVAEAKLTKRPRRRSAAPRRRRPWMAKAFTPSVIEPSGEHVARAVAILAKTVFSRLQAQDYSPAEMMRFTSELLELLLRREQNG